MPAASTASAAGCGRGRSGARATGIVVAKPVPSAITAVGTVWSAPVLTR
ncbi:MULTISPECIES: hypothetical protein [unclassified Streptomyces]